MCQVVRQPDPECQSESVASFMHRCSFYRDGSLLLVSTSPVIVAFVQLSLCMAIPLLRVGAWQVDAAVGGIAVAVGQADVPRRICE